MSASTLIPLGLGVLFLVCTIAHVWVERMAIPQRAELIRLLTERQSVLDEWAEVMERVERLEEHTDCPIPPSTVNG